MSATSSLASSMRAQEGSMFWDSATMQLFLFHLHTQQHRVGGDTSTPGPGTYTQAKYLLRVMVATRNSMGFTQISPNK